MSIVKNSVSKLLLALMALLAIGALTSTAIQMFGAFGRYSDSLETERLAAADKAIFHGVLSLRNNRGDAQSAILGEDEPRAKLGAAEKAEQGGYDAIIAALATVEFARRDELAGTLKQRWGEAAPQFQLFYDEAKRPRAERKIERTNSWYDAVTKVIETANLASTAVSNRAWMNDPYIARMIQVRRFAWQVRDRYGIHCSSLRSNVNGSKPLDDAQKRSVAQWDGTIASGWAGMAELLAAPDVTAELVTAASDAKAKTDGVLKQINDLTKNFDGSGKPAMPAADWNTLCQSPFASIVAVANKALDQSIARAETVQQTALTKLIVQSCAFLLALAVTLAGVFVVRNRLMRPVRAILDAIARIGARDYATPVPQSRHPDEFGTMAAALESLRESAATAERLGQERESQQALQLARSGTVDSACRSFDDTVQAVIQSVVASTRELDDTATGVRSLVSESSNQTAAVSSAAEQATNNLETIAAATEEPLRFRGRDLGAGAGQRPRGSRSRSAGRADQRDGRDSRPDREPHRRGREDDQRHRRPDQPSGLERYHRSRARGRGRPRFRRGRRRGQEPGLPDGDSDGRDLASGRGDPGRDGPGGCRHPFDRRRHWRHRREDDGDCRRRRAAACSDHRDLAQLSAGGARHPRGHRHHRQRRKAEPGDWQCRHGVVGIRQEDVRRRRSSPRRGRGFPGRGEDRVA